MSSAGQADTAIEIRVDVAHEIREISNDFAQPIELLREVLANSYDAGAEEVVIRVVRGQDPARREILDLDIIDDGIGMDRAGLECFFGLGFNHKPSIPGRPPIGAKGHGTKIYYNAIDIWVATRQRGGELFVTRTERAREHVHKRELPVPRVWHGDEARAQAEAVQLQLPGDQGTSIRLIDFTPDSGWLIDDFKRDNLENYIRWFTIYGSFEHVLRGTAMQAPLRLLLQATDQRMPTEVPFGHPWPDSDCTDLRTLKARDQRRPFNYFRKRFHSADRPIAKGYRIDIAALFEGKHARLERDRCIRRQGADRLYTEEQRYGIWLCKNHIPIEKAEPLPPEASAIFAVLEPHRALILVNCDEFELTANRGSVGNSKAALREAVHQGIIDYLEEIESDEDVRRFLEEYEEDRLARLREKDSRAFQRRLARYNKKNLCSIQLPGGEPFEFFEPQREITLFGLISQLEIVDPDLLHLEILDYDDYRGIDLLVRKKTADPGDLLARDKVAYTEIKHVLESNINHAFANLYAIVCWESDVLNGGKVTDPTGESFVLGESQDQHGVTHTVLMPPPHNTKLSHQVRVIVLERLMLETRGYQERANPRAVKNGSR